MEKLTVEELCKFMETFGKKEICPFPKVPLYSFRVWLEGPELQQYDDFGSIEQRFIDFIFDNNFKYNHDKTDTLKLENKYILSVHKKDKLPEGIDLLMIIMPGEGYDKKMGKDSMGINEINGQKVCLHPRNITIMMWGSEKK